MHRLVRWSSAVLGLLLMEAAAIAAAQTQTLRLDAGWNLIAFQVIPTNASPTAVFGSLGGAFDRVFSYDTASKSWSSFGAATNAAGLLPLGAVGPGRGYWIHMAQAVPAWNVTGEPPALVPAVPFSPGWNLIGVPVGAAKLSEPVNLLSVLAASGLDYDTVLRWERSLYGKFTPTDTDLDDFTAFDAGRGYWVNVRSGALNLQPQLLVSARPDTDVEPVGNYPSYEDIKLSTSSIPLDANSQTHIRFLPGEETQTLALANTGGGILLWQLSATNAPWLQLSATNGVTTIENDVVTLSLDRTRMSRAPIRLAGHFTLQRESPVPFTSRHATANRESTLGNDSVVLLRTDSTRSIPVGTTSFPLQAMTDFQLASLQVEVDITDTPPTDLRLSLRTPSGRTLVLHDKSALSSLQKIVFPTSRAPKDDFGSFLATGPVTRGEWRLIVENTGSTPGRLNNFGLRLAGQPVFDVSGEVVRYGSPDSTNFIPVVSQVFVDGLPFSASMQTDAQGKFQFKRLPGMPLNFSATQVGYRPFDPEVPGLGRTLTVPQFDPTCLSPAGKAALQKFRPLTVTPVPSGAVSGFASAGGASNPYRLQLDFGGNFQVNGDSGLVALPFIGPAPLPVDLVLATESAYDGTPPVSWEYGDGTPVEIVGSLFRQHTYTNVSRTGYEVVFRIQGVDAFVLRRGIYPMPSPGNTPYALNFFTVNFTGGGSLPVGALSQITGSNNPAAPAALATLLQVQAAYTASFDMDLAPAAAPGKRFDSDGFDPLGTVVNPANRTGNFRDEDYNYTVAQGTGPGQWLLAADCGYAVPDDIFNASPKPGQTGDCAGPRFAALCNIGAPIVPDAAAEVYPVTPGAPPIAPSDPDPLSAAGASGVAAGRGLRLIAGPLSGFWNQGASR